MGPVLKSLVICSLVLVSAAQADTVLPDWRQVEEPFPLLSATPDNPVLTVDDVIEPNANLVADPFLFFDNDLWYMFFEVAFEERVISLATSPNGLDWTYDQIVLNEVVQLSFPFVFKHNQRYYMVPETKYLSEVRLYEALDFPYGRTYTTTLLSGREFVDPVIVYRDNTWWLFVGLSGSQYLYLYYADTLLGPWTEHPMSPIINNRSKARPAGRFIEYDQDRLIRLAQKCDVTYGEAVRAFEVDVLTRTHYSEHEISDSPILQPGDSGWNDTGMHHCDPWWTGSYWLSAVDGREDNVWSIGIYQTRDLANVPWPGASDQTGALRLLQNSPNPASDRTEIRYTIDPSLAAMPARLNVYDVSGGRLIHAGRIPLSSASGSIIWNGRDTAGRPVPAGMYVYELQVGDLRWSKPMVIVR